MAFSYRQTTNNDRASHRAVMSALEVIGFSREEINAICHILATILLLVRYASPLFAILCLIDCV